MTDANSPAFTQDFKIEILTNGPDAAPSFIAPALCAAIVGWEREFNEEEESDEDGFMIQGVDDAPDDTGDDEGDDTDDGDDGDDGDDEDGVIVEEDSDSVLNLRTTVNAAVLADVKAIQAMDLDERLTVRIIYGTEDAKLIRQFSIAPDLGILMSGGDKTTDLLEIVLVADVFDAETIF